MREKLCTLVLLLLLLLARRAAAGSGLGAASNGSSISLADECGQRCQAEQRAALVQLYNRLNGPQWIRQRYWLSSAHHCSWAGVSCCRRVGAKRNGSAVAAELSSSGIVANVAGLGLDREGINPPCRVPGSVTALELASNNVSGAITDELLAAAFAPLAPTCASLYARSNQLAGPLAPLLRVMRGLEHVALGNNLLTGTLPAEMGATMRQLSFFVVSENALSGQLPASLAKLESLRLFVAVSNKFTGAVPVEMLAGENLLILMLGSNRLTELPTPTWAPSLTPPAVMRERPAVNSQEFWAAVVERVSPLYLVSLHGNALASTLPPWLFALPVFTLDLSANRGLVGTLPAFFGHNPLLREINLDGCSARGRIPDGFDSPNLNVVTLRDNQLSGPLPQSLALQAHVLILQLTNNRLTGTLPPTYDRLVGATHVLLSGNNLTVNAGLPPWLSINTTGRTFVNADSSGKPDLVCDPLAVAGSSNTLFELDASYYGWEGCRCQDPNAWLVRSGAGVNETLMCALDPGAFMLPAWGIATIIVVILALAALLLLAGWLAWRCGFVHAFAQWRANAAKRKPPGQEEGKEVTLVLTGIEGGAELRERDADVTSAAIALHDRLLRSYMGRFYGYEVTTEGDAFLVAFHDPFDAAAWCLTVQLALMCIDWPEALLQHKAAAPSGWDAARGPGADSLLFRGLRVRMAVTTGRADAVRTHAVTKRLEYKGAVLKRVQVLADAAHGGQVLLGPDAFAAVHGRLLELSALASHTLQRLPQTSAAVGAAVAALTRAGEGEHGARRAASAAAPLERTASSRFNNGLGSTVDAELAGQDAATAVAPTATVDGASGHWWRCWHLTAGQQQELRQSSVGALEAGAQSRWEGATAIDEGTHELAGLAEPMSVVQLQPCGLEERARMLPPIASRQQLTPGYFDAPAARLAPLGARAPAVALPEVVIMFCAIDGFDAMLAHDEAAAELALAMYVAALRWLLLVVGGYECLEDDGAFMAAFADADAAVEWCLMVQQTLQDVSWPDAVLELPGAKQLTDQHGNVVFRGPRVKMGLYRGVPARVVPHNTGRADYFGPVVNRAARFCHGAAYGGQVLVPQELLLGVVQSWLGDDDGDGDDSRRVVLPAAGEPPAQLVARFDSAAPRSWPWLFAARLGGGVLATAPTASFCGSFVELRRAASAQRGALPPTSFSSKRQLLSRKASGKAPPRSLASMMRARTTHVSPAEVAALFAAEDDAAAAAVAAAAGTATGAAATAACSGPAMAARRWLWARQLLVREVGAFRFKGVSGVHAVLSVTSERLAGRAFPTAHRAKGKAEQVAPGRGPVLGVRLVPA